VDALVKMMPHNTRRNVSILAVLLSLLYVGFVLTGASIYVLKMKEVGIEFEDMPIERWMVLIIMPLGFLLTGWRFIQILVGLVTGKTDSLRLADEAAEAMRLKSEEAPS
jgi:C4-dicarboxylate transporter DctQ subunit